MDSGWRLICCSRSTHNKSLSKSIEEVLKKGALFKWQYSQRKEKGWMENFKVVFFLYIHLLYNKERKAKL